YSLRLNAAKQLRQIVRKIRCNGDPRRCFPELASADIELVRARQRLPQREGGIFWLGRYQKYEHADFTLGRRHPRKRPISRVSARSVRISTYCGARSLACDTRRKRPTMSLCAVSRLASGRTGSLSSTPRALV